MKIAQEMKKTTTIIFLQIKIKHQDIRFIRNNVLQKSKKKLFHKDLILNIIKKMSYKKIIILTIKMLYNDFFNDLGIFFKKQLEKFYNNILCTRKFEFFEIYTIWIWF